MWSLQLSIISALSASTFVTAGVISRRDFTDALGRDVAYLGCYIDNAARVLTSNPFPVAGLADISMTQEGCALGCAAAGFPVSGTEYASQCFCGVSIDIGDLASADSQCNMPCTGNGAENCGAGYRLSVFQTTMPVPTVISSYTDTESRAVSYSGCYVDVSTRTLPFAPDPETGLSATTMTPELCALGCADAGFPFSGTEYASECYCGATIDVGNLAGSDAECDMICSGDITHFCGAGWRLSVLETVLPIAPTTDVASYTDANGRAVTYSGCYIDTAARLLPFGPDAVVGLSDSTMTPELCALGCANAGFPYSGTEYASECYCGNTISSSDLALADTDCNVHCSGDGTQYCGAGWRLSVLQTVIATPTVVAGYTDSLSRAVTYRGCYVDTSSRILSGNPAPISGLSGSTMTPELCALGCAAAGFPISGTEYASQCFCGASISDLDLASADTDCNMACTGDATQYCGGGYLLTVLSTDLPAPADVASYTDTSGRAVVYLGCYVDTNVRALGFAPNPETGLSATTMTPEVCALGCAAAGFPISGTEYASECYCGSAIDIFDLAGADTDCNMVCSGDITHFCGAGWRLSVLQTTL